MVISEMLYVGTGPANAAPYKGPVNVSSADQAARLIRDGVVAVVPTTDVARDTLVILGYGQAWAAFATERTTSDVDLEDWLGP